MNVKDHKIAFFSMPGRKKDNQDSILVKELGDGSILLAVADGMGGSKGGEVASKIAVNTVSSFFENSHVITTAFQSVKMHIEAASLKDPDIGKMGTTLTVAIVRKNTVEIGHVGDCRIYQLRGNGIVSLTKDQTEVQKLIDDKIITKRVAQNYHRKNILLSVMAANVNFDLQYLTVDIKEHDRLLLLSDGAYSLASKREIRDLSLSHNEIDTFLVGVKGLIESRKIRDDYSAIAYEYLDTAFHISS